MQPIVPFQRPNIFIPTDKKPGLFLLKIQKNYAFSSPDLSHIALRPKHSIKVLIGRIVKKTKKAKNLTLSLSNLSQYVPYISQNIRKLRIIDRREVLLDARLNRSNKPISRPEPTLARCKALESLGVQSESNFGFLKEARKLTQLQRLYLRISCDTLPDVFKVLAKLHTINECNLTIVPNDYYIDWQVLKKRSPFFFGSIKKARNLQHLKLDSEVSFGFGGTSKIFLLLSWIKDVSIESLDITLRISGRGLRVIKDPLSDFSEFLRGLDSLTICCNPPAWKIGGASQEYCLSDSNKKGRKRLCLILEEEEYDFNVSRILSCCSYFSENLSLIDNTNNLSISEGLKISPALKQLNVVFGYNNEHDTGNFLTILSQKIKENKRIEILGFKTNQLNYKATLKFLQSNTFETLKELSFEVGFQGKGDLVETLLTESLCSYKNLEKLRLNVGIKCPASILSLSPLVKSVPETVKEMSLRIYGVTDDDQEQIKIDTDLLQEKLVHLEKLDMMFFGKFSEESIQEFGEEVRVLGKKRNIEISYAFSEVKKRG